MWSPNKPKTKKFSTDSSSPPPTWPGTRELAERQVRQYGVRFEVVKRQQEIAGLPPETRTLAFSCSALLHRGPVTTLFRG